MKNIVKICLTTFIAFVMGMISIKASSFSASVNNSNPTVGQTVTLSISGSDLIGKFNIVSSDTSVISLSSSTVWVENNTMTITVATKNVGSATISVVPETVANGNGEDLSLAAKSVTINVKAKAVVVPPANLSANNYLKSLAIENVAMEPIFNKNTLEYKVNLGVGTEILKINAEAEDNTAKISGIGDVKVSEGTNTINVVVTAQNGQVKTYVIKAEVEETNPIDVVIGDNIYRVIKKKELLPSAQEEYTLSTVLINDIEIPCYKKERMNYVLVGLKDSDGNIKLYTYSNNNYSIYLELTFNSLIFIPTVADKVPDGYEESTIMINNNVVTCYKNGTDFVLIYGTNLTNNDTGFYSYDTVDNTLQRYSKELKYSIKAEETNDELIKIIYGLVAICAVLIVFSAIQGTINKKKNKSKDSKKEVKSVVEDVKKEVISKDEKENKTSDDLIEQIDESYNKIDKDKKKKKKKDFLDETSVDIYKIDL